MRFNQVTECAIADLRPYAANARTHSKKQLRQIGRSIERFGFTNPVLVSSDGEIIAGHGRVEAARQLGWKTVPTIALAYLTGLRKRGIAITRHVEGTTTVWSAAAGDAQVSA